MNPEQISEQELTLDEKVAILTKELPKPIQNFLHSPERDAVSSDLSRKYALHADQAGIFERSYLYMLLGVYSPEEFVQELRTAGITEQATQGLTADINERVFKRLQSAERAEPIPAAPAPIYVPPQTIASVLQAPAPFNAPHAISTAPASLTAPAAPIYVPPAAPAPVSVPVPPPAPAAVPSTVPVSAPISMSAPQPFVPPAPVAIPSSSIPVEHPAIRTMAHDMQMAKEEKQHPHAPKSVWQAAAPARTFQTSSVPNTGIPAQPAAAAPIPAPQPFAIPTVAPTMPQAPAFAPAQMPARPAAASVPVPPNLPGQQPGAPAPFAAPSIPSFAQPATAQPIVKEYGIDPYRETPA